MAVFVTTNGITSTRLLAMIKQEITNYNVRTWQFNSATGFVHITKSGEWNKGGYLEIQDSSTPGELVLYVKYVPGSKCPVGTFGVLNGRFAEMIANHFRDHYTSIVIKDLR